MKSYRKSGKIIFELLHGKSLTRKEIEEQTGLTENATSKALAALRKKGMVKPTPGKHPKWAHGDDRGKPGTWNHSAQSPVDLIYGLLPRTRPRIEKITGLPYGTVGRVLWRLRREGRAYPVKNGKFPLWVKGKETGMPYSHKNALKFVAEREAPLLIEQPRNIWNAYSGYASERPTDGKHYTSNRRHPTLQPRRMDIGLVGSILAKQE